VTRRRLVVGNWKMHTTRTEAVLLATALRDSPAPGDVEVAVCPPFPWLEVVSRLLSGTHVAVGGQDCWHEQSGAYTGQVSPVMLSELCSLVITGHSEHRRDAAESNELVARKAAAAAAAGLTPIVCVGESLEMREAGDAQAWVGQQVDAVLEIFSGSDALSTLIVAYEPIWAIGTGHSATTDDAQQMAEFIRRRIDDVSAASGESVRILYGGSVSDQNAAGFIGQQDVDGLLVGGASLDAGRFLAILDAC
jgi:triosephosphate isomerase (TIM)